MSDYCINNMHEKLPDSDWLRKEYKMCNTSAKNSNIVQITHRILNYDWLMNNRVWSGPIKSFAF